MEAAKSKTAAPAPAPAPAPAAHPVRAVVPPGRVQLQSALKVSSPGDAAEKEAESTARKIVRMPRPAEPAVGPPRPLQSPHVARFGAVGPAVQRKAEGQPNVSANVAAEISASTASGSPLPASVRRFMEPRFRTDLSNVRIHTNERSARLNRQLNAQAFTVGNQIFFGRGRFRPEAADGQELLAHELTHTIQQGAAVQRSAEAPVTQQSPQQVQRLGLSDALDYFADKANLIPGFRMFTIILGVNPVNMSRVERSAANILRAVIEMIPGGALITQALDNHGVFARAGAWVEQQINTLGMTGSLIRDAIDRFLDSLSWTDIFDLGGVWDRAKRIFTEPIDRIISFIGGLVSGLISLIKDAILRPLARLAQGTRGYDLLKAVLGQDPITGDPVPRNAETLIGGFMHLIGQDEIWQNIQRANAVARAWAWFQGALSGLWSFVQQIPSLFIQAFRSLEISDIILLPRAFEKIASVFGGFIGRFLSWAGETIWSLLEIIFSVLAPSVMPYLRRAAAAFRTILRNPIGFVGNLVRAGILGLRQFARNFVRHLTTSLIGWLTGALSGANIYIPQGLNLREILKFTLSVLGLTWQNIRQKLVRATSETTVRVLETSFDIVMTLVTQGPAAAWEKILETLSNLRAMVIDRVVSFIREQVIEAAITRLVTSLNPVGAFIQAIIAIYNTVMFFVERLRQIAQVAAAVIDSISAIASGVLTTAANRVEQTMAGLLTLVISFLARIAGLGRVSDMVTEVVNRIRQPIDQALDRVVQWIVETARRVGRLIVGTSRAGAADRGGLIEPIPFPTEAGTHTLRIRVENQRPVVTVATTETPVAEWLQRWRDRIGSWRDPDAKAEGQRHLAILTDRLRELNLAADQAMTQRTSATDPRGAYAPQLRGKGDELINTSLRQLFELMPENAPRLERFAFAWTVPLFQRGPFTLGDWSVAQSKNSNTAWGDLEWGVEVGKLDKSGDRYQLRMMDREELERTAVRLLLSEGRSRLGGQGRSFGIPELQAFFLNPQLRGLPRNANLYDADFVTLTANALVGGSLIRDGNQYKWSFELLDERTLPDGWGGEDTRYKFYIRGSGFGSAVTRVKRDGMRDILAVIRANPLLDPMANARWNSLRLRGGVPDEDYNPGRRSVYEAESSYDVDHEWPLAWHWEFRNGWNSSQSARHEAAGGSGTYPLRLMWGPANRAKGARAPNGEVGSYERRKVGREFTSAWAPDQRNFIWADDSRPFKEYGPVARR